MGEKMTYQATDFLAGLFGRRTAAATLVVEPDRQPEPMAAPATSGTADRATVGIDPGEWHRQPGVSGRMGWQRRDLAPGEWPNFDELPNPEPCPACGSLELWETVAADADGVEPGRWRCLRCDPPAKSRAWAARAAELRRNGPPWENRGPDTPEDATEATYPAQETFAASGDCAAVYGALAER